jgi:hypothetical protein
MRVDSSFDTCLITDLLTTKRDTKSASTSPNVEEAKVVETPKKPKPKEPTLTFDERVLATAVISRLRFLEELQNTLKQLSGARAKF